jgi:hypothetical protein
MLCRASLAGMLASGSCSFRPDMVAACPSALMTGLMVKLELELW